MAEKTTVIKKITMKNLLVHLHIYYHDQVDYFIEKLNNINGINWKLIVTYSQRNEKTEKKLRQFKPDVEFVETENIGYDIWPFIKVIKSIDLSDYDYIIKLHTKRNVDKITINKVKLKDYEWRNSLVNAILNDPKYFQKLLLRFESDKTIGMASSLATLSLNAWDIYKSRIGEEMKKLNIGLHKGFVSLGTMFMARSEIFQPFKSEWLSSEYFYDHQSRSGFSFTKSHIYERIFSLLPLHFGLRHIGVTPDLKLKLRINAGRTFKGPMEWFFCIYRKGEEHRKALRLFGIEFYIGKPQEIKFTDTKENKNE